MARNDVRATLKIEFTVGAQVAVTKTAQQREVGKSFEYMVIYIYIYHISHVARDNGKVFPQESIKN